MDDSTRVAVCSRSFSRNKVLREELLRRYEHVSFNEDGAKLSGASLVDFLKGHDKAITALETIDETILSELPDLKAIGKYGVGLDMIDMAALRKYGIRLGWTGGVNRRSVAELVIALSISMLREVRTANELVVGGGWRQIVGRDLSGSTVGIIGCGHVGKDLVSLLQPFGCKLLAHDIQDFPEFYKQHNVQPVDLDSLMTKSDVISIHVPLDEGSKNLLSKEVLSLMKPTAVLINLARGGLVDESALKEILKNNQIAAAAFDVFGTEPPVDTELLRLPNFLATPHIGGSSQEAILAMGRAAIDGLEDNRVP